MPDNELSKAVEVNITKNATLVEVAKKAEVSVSTAARVLRNSDYRVDDKLKERVNAAAKAVGYVPNLVARRLRGGKQGVVGLVIGDMLDAHYGMIAESVTERAETAHSTFAIVCNMQRDPLLEIKYLRKLLEYRVDGIILAGGGFDQWTHQEALTETIEEIKRSGTIVASLMPRNIKVPVFSADNEAIGITKAKFIVQNGHTRIGILLGPARNEMTKLRMQSMTSFLSGHMVDYAIANIASTPEAARPRGCRNVDPQSRSQRIDLRVRCDCIWRNQLSSQRRHRNSRPDFRHGTGQYSDGDALHAETDNR